MKTRVKRLARSIALGVLLCIAGTGAVYAQAPTCELVTTNLDVTFSALSNTFVGPTLDTAAADKVRVKCTGRSGWINGEAGEREVSAFRVCVGLADGSGGASGASRQMKNGSNTVHYQLYKNTGRTIPIGLVGGNHDNIYDGHERIRLGTFFQELRTITMEFGPFYGRIAPGQSTVAVGDYSSTFSPADVQIRWGGVTSSGGFNHNPSAPPCEQLTNTLTHPGFQVKVSVLPACTLTVPPQLDFGTRSTPGELADASAQISAHCNTDTSYTIGISNGNHALGGQRRMRRTTVPVNHTIDYGLFRNAARTQLWGDAADNRMQATGSGVNQQHTIYARAQVPNPIDIVGEFMDTVVVTLYYN